MSDAPNTTAARDTLGGAIGHLGWLLDRQRDEGGLSPGDRAELRRMDPTGAALPPALWRLLTIRDVAAALPEHDAEPFERAFAVLIQVMAEIGAVGDPSVGATLAASAYAEQRFVRLLRARGLVDVAHQARLAAQWCAGKGIRLRFRDRYRHDGFGPFILDAALGRESADRRAHAIARDYFRQSSRDERAPTTPEPAQ